VLAIDSDLSLPQVRGAIAETAVKGVDWGLLGVLSEQHAGLAEFHVGITGSWRHLRRAA
jgi:hypothetical protein